MVSKEPFNQPIHYDYPDQEWEGINRVMSCRRNFHELLRSNGYKPPLRYHKTKARESHLQ